MKNIKNLLIKDIKKRAKSPWGIVIMLIIPLVMTAIFGAIFSPKKSAMPKISFLVCDQDKSPVSQFFRGMVANQQMRERFTISFVTETEGTKLIRDNKASAMLIIPKGFQENLFNNIKTDFKLFKNPSEQFLPQITQEFLETFAVMLSGVVNIFAEEIQVIRKEENLSLESIDLNLLLPHMNKLKDKIVNLRKYLSPLLVKLETEKPEEKESGKPQINFFQAFLPSISILFVLFFVEVFLRDILVEKEDGTQTRIMLAPVTAAEYVTSKILSGFIMGIFSQLTIFISGALLFDIQWGDPVKLMLMTLSSSLFIAAFFAVIYSLCRTKSQAENVASPIILISALLGGSMLPSHMLPGFLKTLSPVTVNYWYIQGMNQILVGKSVTQQAIVLSSAGAILMILAFILLPRKVSS